MPYNQSQPSHTCKQSDGCRSEPTEVLLERFPDDVYKHLPDTYYGHTIDRNGCFHIDEKVTRYIDHACETWFYGHDKFEGGNCIPWMRSREVVDRDNNDVHEMENINGIWRYSYDA